MKHTAAILFVLLIFATGCSSSQVTATPGPDANASGANTFSLASDFPSDIVIPDIDGMRSTAFVVSAADPAGVLAVDIDSSPMKLAANFKGLVTPPGLGIPSRLAIASAEQAFLLTSNSIVSFNPTTGDVIDVASALAEVAIDEGHNNSDGSASARTIVPAYPGGIALSKERLFVSSANYLQTSAPAVAAPGTVQVFKIGQDGSIGRLSFFITSGYNPTGLAVKNDDELLVTNSGVIDIIDAQGVPQTGGGIDIVDVATLSLKATIELGLVAASPYGIALSKDGSMGFLGSAAFGHVYEIDLVNNQVLRGLSNPISTGNSVDYISATALSVDDRYLYASSFETSSIVPFDLSSANPGKGNPYVIGYSAGVTDQNPTGAKTGAGPIAVRPGSRGIDYTGADLFALTGHPGQIIAIDTGAAAQKYVAPAQDQNNVADNTPVPAAPTGSDGDSCQGFAQAVKEVQYGTGAGFGQSLMPDVVLGPPRGAGDMQGGTHVLSLGKGGEIVLDLGNCHIKDGAGADFIVFENAFYIGGDTHAPYKELAVVGASEDGVTFKDFPCKSDSYPYDGCAGWHPVYSNPQNGISPFDPAKAGGDAFDLNDIGLAEARYIRIVDNGNNGGGGAAGFDLDAVAVINGEIAN